MTHMVPLANLIGGQITALLQWAKGREWYLVPMLEKPQKNQNGR